MWARTRANTPMQQEQHVQLRMFIILRLFVVISVGTLLVHEHVVTNCPLLLLP
jgi:hypothetical protein